MAGVESKKSTRRRNFTTARNRRAAKLLWRKFHGAAHPAEFSQRTHGYVGYCAAFMAVRFISRCFHSGNSLHPHGRLRVPLFFVSAAFRLCTCRANSLWRSIVSRRLCTSSSLFTQRNFHSRRNENYAA